MFTPQSEENYQLAWAFSIKIHQNENHDC